MDAERKVVRQRELLQKIKRDDAALVVAGEPPPRAGAMRGADGYGKSVIDCGDTVEIYLRLEKGEVVDTTYLVKGCVFTLACAREAAALVRNKCLADARRDTSPDGIAASIGDLPEENEHCAELASEAVAKALEDAAASMREPWRKTYRRNR